MAPRDIRDALAAARAEVDQVCEWLRSPSPETMDRCAVVLESAGRQLAVWQPGVSKGAGHGEVHHEAGQLRDSVRKASRLLQSACDFHFNWVRRRSAFTGGYTWRGDPAEWSGAGRISVRG